MKKNNLLFHFSNSKVKRYYPIKLPIFLKGFIFFCMLLVFNKIHSQNNQGIPITGTVTSAETGETLPGVNVVIESTTMGTVTGSNGEFSLRVAGDNVILVFSFIGYEPLSVPIGNQQIINVGLTPSLSTLEEFVVVGYGRVERREITGSIASIDRATIVSEPIYSVENLLQGRAAGVDVTANSYRPGAGSTIRIRGIRSFVAGNDPLIVLDGVPMEGDLSGLNPSDVESIEILKDASATAIYGSRGANGVILVTTQRGPLNATVIDYSMNTGIQRLAQKVDLMNAEQYIEMQRDAARREGSYTTDDALFLDWEKDAIARGVDTDWQDLIFNDGFQQNHNLSVRGGTNKTRYTFSGTYTQHDAMVENNDFNRYIGRINLDQDVTDIFRAGVSAQVSYSREHQGGNFRDLVLRSPIDWPERAEEAIRNEFAVGESFPTIAIDPRYFIDQRDRTRIFANIFAELDILEGLSYRFNVAPDINFYERGTHNAQNSTASVANQRIRNMLYENIIDFRRSFGVNHRIRATALYSVQTNNLEGSSISVRGLPFQQQRFHNIGTAEETLNRNSTLRDWVLESYMLRLNYALLDKYMFTVTGRIDGSSRLAEGNKYGLFPSVAFAWLLNEESFMTDQNLFNELKLRLSFGDVGNTGIQPYQTQGRVSRLGYAFGEQSNFGFQSVELANQDLRWERTRSLDIGLDFGMFNNRIFGTLGVYQQNTIDLLMNRQLPPTSGYSVSLQNVGSTRNRGLEVSLSTIIVEPKTRDGFRWQTDYIFSANKNEIIELYGGKEDDPGNKWFIGQPVNIHYDWVFDGVWQEDEAAEAAKFGLKPGDIKLRDINGDGGIGAEDREILGSEVPSWTGSFNSRMHYKNFDLAFLVYTSQGVTIWSEAGGNSLGGMLNLRRGYNLNSRNIAYHTPDNPSNEFPRPRVTGHPFFAQMGYYDASYVRVRNITLGYTVQSTTLTNMGLRKARLYAAVQNPFTFTEFPGHDPEGARNHDMPNYRTFLMGVEIGL